MDEQAKADFPGLLDRFADTILKVVNKIKCGTLIKQTPNGWLVDFNINKGDGKEPLMEGAYEFPVCELFHSKNDYKQGDQVVVLFFDDYEEQFVKNKQMKNVEELGTSYKHALTNGMIIANIGKQTRSYIDFVNGLHLISEFGALISLGSKIKMKNGTTNIVSMFGDMIDTLFTQLQVVPTALNAPCTFQNAADVKTAMMGHVQKLFEI